MADKRDKYFIDLKVDQREGLSEMEAMVKAMTRLRAERRKINKELRDGVITERAHAKALDRIQVQLKGLSGRYREASNAASGLTKQGIRFRDKIAGSMTRSLAKLGAAFAATFAVDRIMQFGREVVRMNAELSDSFADVQKTTGLTLDQVQSLDSEFAKFSTRTSRTELLKLAEVAGRLNIQGTQNITDFVEQANQIQVALGDILGEGAVLDIGRSAAAYDESLLAIGSAINELGNTTRANEDYIQQFLTFIQGTAQNLRISAADIAAYGATFGAFGARLESTGTAMSKIFNLLVQNTEDFEDAANMTRGSLSELIGREGVNEGFLGFVSALNESSTSSQDFINTLEDLGLADRRTGEAFQTLANNIDEYRRNQETSTKATREATSITEEYEVKNQNLAASFDKLSQAWERFTTGLVESTALQEAIGDLTEFFQLMGAETELDALLIRREQLQREINKAIDQGSEGAIEYFRHHMEIVNSGIKELINQREFNKEKYDQVALELASKKQVEERVRLLRGELLVLERHQTNFELQEVLRRRIAFLLGQTVESEKDQEKAVKDVNKPLTETKTVVEQIAKLTKEVEENIGGWALDADPTLSGEGLMERRVERAGIFDTGVGFVDKDTRLAADEAYYEALQNLVDTNLAQIDEKHKDAEESRRNTIFTSLDAFQQVSGLVIQNAQETAARRLEIELNLLDKLHRNNEISTEEFARLQEQARKREFERGKQLRIVQATIDAAAAFVNALATPGVGIAEAFAKSALALSRIAIISSQQFADGGVVGLSDGKINKQSNIPTQSNGDNVLATVRTGEVILNKQQQAALGGANTFKAIGVPGFADGGLVAPRPQLNLDTSNNQIDYVRLASAMSSFNVQTSIVEIIDNLATQNQITQLKRL